jgi:UV DNA damage endonuclease
MTKIGLCCISITLKKEGYSFNKMTYKRFSSLPRAESINILGKRIHNNLVVTEKTIRYCADNDLCYRMSSDLFPLITYDKANVKLSDLPNHDDIQNMFDVLKQTIIETKVRISAHPSEHNVLASKNEAAVKKTIDELNFYSSFMDRIGCPANHESPMNLHIHNKDGSYDEIINRFMSNFSKLDKNCQDRLVCENDDKSGGWSVKELVEHFYAKTKICITFDYLHHKCNPDGLDEKTALDLCYKTWDTKPLFHYSESKEGNNPRSHADYAVQPIDKHNTDFDLDFELKEKCLAIKKYKELYPNF